MDDSIFYDEDDARRRTATYLRVYICKTQYARALQEKAVASSFRGTPKYRDGVCSRINIRKCPLFAQETREREREGELLIIRDAAGGIIC